MQSLIGDDLALEQQWLLPERAPELDEPPPSHWESSALWDVARITADSDTLRALGIADLARLARSQFSPLPGAGLVDSLLAIERHRAWLDGLARVALGAIADADTADHRAANPAADLAGQPGRTTEFWCQEEVAAALRLAPVTASHRLRDAQRLCHHLPRTLNALLTGRIWGSQASAITTASTEIADDLLPAFEDAIIGRAEHQTLTQTTRSARRAVLRLDPSTARQRQNRAFADRDVNVHPADNDMAVLSAQLLAADALAINALLDAAADQQLTYDRDHHQQPGRGPTPDATTTPDTPRTKPQIKADILVDLILSTLDPAHLPQRHGRRPVINIHITLDTLTSTDNQPAWLDGYGPITPDTARTLASDPTGTWRRLLTDPATHTLLAYDITSYRPPAAITEHLLQTHLTCTFPGCTRAAERCDLDHITPHSRSGTTTPCNLHTLCRRHHRLKHQTTWQVTKHDNGAIHWTSPQGRKYVIPPRTRLTEPTIRAQSTTTQPQSAHNDDPPPF